MDFVEESVLFNGEDRSIADEVVLSFFLELVEALQSLMSGKVVSLFDASMLLIQQFARSASLIRYWEFLAEMDIKNSMNYISSNSVQLQLAEIWGSSFVEDKMKAEAKMILVI